MRALSQRLVDHYRCPETCVNFRLQGALSETGFFRFGPDLTLYGRSSSAKQCGIPEVPLCDLSDDLRTENSELLLPFDPAEVIDNLRLERYVPTDSKVRLCAKLAYYCVRPLLFDAGRRSIQRMQLGSWGKLPFPHWPVDTTVETLCERLLVLSMEALGIDRLPFIWFWPDGARSCVMMTHDVDTRKGKECCSALMDIDDRFGVRASFQVVPEERYDVPDDFLATIRERGFEIGVQDLNHDGRLFDNRKEFLRRAERINGYGRKWGAEGFRAAVLYRRPEWYDALDFAFDMSIPNVAHLDPQRGGCCTVMPYFIGDILEIPLTTTQDYMLLHLLGHHSIDLWKSQIQRIGEKNGLASFIVHPDYIGEPKARFLYETLLEYLTEWRTKCHVWFALPSSINQWWRARSKMKLVRGGDGWTIEGESAERAVLAYARCESGSLVYDLQMAAA
jgi:hypothetical protein